MNISIYFVKGQTSHSANIESLQLHFHFLKTVCSIHLKSIKTYKKEMKSLSNYSNPSSGAASTGIFAVASVFLKSNFEYMVSFIERCPVIRYFNVYTILLKFEITI